MKQVVTFVKNSEVKTEKKEKVKNLLFQRSEPIQFSYRDLCSKPRLKV